MFSYLVQKNPNNIEKFFQYKVNLNSLLLTWVFNLGHLPTYVILNPFAPHKLSICHLQLTLLLLLWGEQKRQTSSLAQIPVEVGQFFCLRVDLKKSNCVAAAAAKNDG